MATLNLAGGEAYHVHKSAQETMLALTSSARWVRLDVAGPNEESQSVIVNPAQMSSIREDLEDACHVCREARANAKLAALVE